MNPDIDDLFAVLEGRADNETTRSVEQAMRTPDSTLAQGSAELMKAAAFFLDAFRPVPEDGDRSSPVPLKTIRGTEAAVESRGRESGALPSSMAAHSRPRGPDDEFASIKIELTDPQVIHLDSGVAKPNKAGVIYLWCSPEDQLVQIQLRSSSGAFSPTEGDSARAVVCNSSDNASNARERFVSFDSEVFESDFTDGMVNLVVRRFYFGQGKQIGLQLCRRTETGSRITQFFLIFSPDRK